MSVRPSVAVGLTTVAIVALLRYEQAAPPAEPAARPVAVAPATAAPKISAAPAHPPVAATAQPASRSRPVVAPVRAAVPASAPASRAPAARTATAPVKTAPAPAATHAAPAPSPRPTTTTYTGQTEDTPYGPVQVEIWVSGGRITDVQALQLPNDTPRSQEISSYAGPQLRQEALQAQSANIDTVCGATYTSDGYRQSLQSALDQAHLP